eukprot:c5351_g1_i1.p1 GENE.c5351_g1_i1~~c5351_g1_i1.p1  ORF type:complete len:592 (+),score=195.62 c5351_g1_i1:44-1777(+)
MGIFIDATTLEGGVEGFCQMLFLLVAYGYLLYIGCKLVSEGAELLLLVPAYAGIVGSLILPVLGAVPDGAIVLFSGLGDDAQNQLSVGVGALAGSTIMLLTVPWALSVFAGRVNLDAQGNTVYKRPASDNSSGPYQKLQPSNNRSLTGTGVSVDRSVNKNGKVMIASALSYVFIQGPAFYYLNHDDTPGKVSKDEQAWAIAGFVLCGVCFVAYLALEFFHNTHSEVTERLAIEVSMREIQEGNVSLMAAMAGVLQVHEAETRPLTTGLLPLEAETKSELTKKLRFVLRPFFGKYDEDNSNTLSLNELRPLLRDLGEAANETDLVTFFHRVDNDNSGSIDYNEFVDAMANFLVENTKRVRAHRERGGELELSHVAPQAGESSNSNKIKDEPKNDDDVDEDDAEVPDDIASMPLEKQQAAIKKRAFGMMLVGSLLVLAFSDPMVDVFSSLGDRLNIPSFYIAFVLSPLASNLSEVLASYSFALKKTEKTVSVSLVQLEGAAVMNNTFCLGIFLALIAFRKLEWTFSAETISILAIEIVMFLMSFKKVHRTLDAIFVLSLYPISIALVYALEHANLDKSP